MPPAQQSSSQQGGGGDNSLAPLWIIVGLFMFGGAVWYFAHAEIAAFILKIKLYEAEFVGLFVNTSALVQSIHNTSPGNVKFDDLVSLSTAVGNYLRFPVAVILALLALLVYFSNPMMRFKKTYDMQRLVDNEKTNWPQIMPVVKLDLTNTDIDEGPWAMALSPMQFAKRFQLLQEERTVTDTMNAIGRSKITVTVRRDEAYRIFSLQLGRYWNGADKLNNYTKALFAIFAARADRDGDGAGKLLRQLGASTESGKIDYTGVNELLEKHRNNKAVIKVTEKHAFVLTTMASMLQLARTDGVLASADFLWLKPLDRSLWFMLNSVGRQTPFSEVAGSFAHWLAERSLGRKLSVPMVEEAVNALEIAIKEILYIPDEDL